MVVVARAVSTFCPLARDEGHTARVALSRIGRKGASCSRSSNRTYRI
jgi:hypothetical protein